MNTTSTVVTLPDGMIALAPIGDGLATAMIGLDSGDDDWLQFALHDLRQACSLDGVKVTFPAGPVAATVTLRSELEAYARTMAAAIRSRRFGEVQAALADEAKAQAIYDRLPPSWRW